MRTLRSLIKKGMVIALMAAIILTGAIFGENPNTYAATEVIGFGKATNLVTRDYTFIGKATDTFTWTYNGKTNKLTSVTAKQSCSGIKQLSTLKKKSIKCTKKTDKKWYYTSIYYLILPKPIKKLSDYKFATITVKYELSSSRLKVLSRKWKWSLKESW